MSDSTEPVPPASTASSGTGGGTARYSVPETARRLGISERAVRKRITAGTLEAHKEGTAWVVLLSSTMEAVPAAPAAPGAVPSAVPESGTGAVDVHEAVVQLQTLLAEERQRADRYLESSTIWQSRALQLEERLQALEAGPIAGDVVTEVTSPQRRDPGLERDVAGVRASETLIDRLRHLIGRS